jgi:uncharacterized protein
MKTKKLPDLIKTEWLEKSGSVIVTTTDTHGVPNSIYATCVSVYDDEKILVANNYFCKTLGNVQDGCKGNVLFITKDNKAYQLKGTFDYVTEGELFEDMKNWNPDRLPGIGVAVLTVDEIYSGADKIT